MKKYKHIITGMILLGYLGLNTNAQKYITKEGQIDIFSETPLFTIEATNKKVASILDIETGEIVASTLIRSFKFHEALVEEHMNENYLESHYFPKSVLKGKITNYKEIDFKKDGTYLVEVEGELTLHGQTRPLKEKAEIIIKDGNISGKCTMIVSLKNFEIKIEDLYKDRIKDEIKLDIDFHYKPYTK